MPSRACSRKLVSSTSAPSSSFIMASCPPSVRRFKETKRLFRFCMSKLGLASGVQGERVVPACLRQASPLSVSTLITSAPPLGQNAGAHGPRQHGGQFHNLDSFQWFHINQILLLFCSNSFAAPRGSGEYKGEIWTWEHKSEWKIYFSRAYRPVKWALLFPGRPQCPLSDPLC